MPVDLNRPISQWMPTATYRGYEPDMPEIVLGRLPETMSISVGRAYKGWIVETEQERAALETALEQPIPFVNGRMSFKLGPDAACAAPSQGAGFMALYPPPSDGWPWIVLSAWPAGTSHRTKIQRGRYIWDTYNTESDALEAVAQLSSSFDPSVIHVPKGSRLLLRSIQNPQ